MPSLNKRPRRLISGIAVLAALATLGIGNVSAVAAGETLELENGDFETGTLAGWRVSERGGDEDGWSVTGESQSPLSGYPIPAPPQGEWQAVVDQTGPGSHVLYRDIAVTEQVARLRMQLWYRNGADRFITPRTLWFKKRNQQLRIDLVSPDAKLRSMDADDILATVFRTRVGDPRRMAPRGVGIDLTPYDGETVRLRIAEVDNRGNFLVGVDAVRLVSGES